MLNLEENFIRCIQPERSSWPAQGSKWTDFKNIQRRHFELKNLDTKSVKPLSGMSPICEIATMKNLQKNGKSKLQEEHIDNVKQDIL